MTKGKGRYGQYIRWIFLGIDFLILNLSYLLVCLLSTHNDMFVTKQVWLMMNVAYMAVSYFFSDIHHRRVVYADRVALKVIKAVTLHAVLFLSSTYFLKSDHFAWENFGKLYGVFVVALGAWWLLSRRILKWYRSLGRNYKQIVVIGAGVVGQKLIGVLQSDLGYGYKIVGIFDDKQAFTSSDLYRGTLDKVEQFVHDNPIDEMYCCVPDADNEDVAKLLAIAERNAVDFFYVPQFGRHITRQFELYSLDNVPVLQARPNPLSSPLNAAIKRLFDFTVSSIVLLLSPIVLIPVAIAIKMSSPGPIFFKQKRTGLRGESFTCYKFRTMRVNAQSDTLQATKNDPRKTKLGDILRKTSIDELPQFYNVWRGDMSIVGPRPHMESHTQQYSELIDKYMLRHVIKPGVTGWAQVNGYRGLTDELWKMEKRVEYDVWYTENWNFFLDLKIIVLTVVNAIRGEKNAF
ncbi:MAG: undecaprenyl-phosphate glucose phosphotransferase [Bacteroidales bacterium]|nr:undecaprenyl-phosphate glucose phosphotransferase [Bacteroidales bacterium]